MKPSKLVTQASLIFLALLSACGSPRPTPNATGVFIPPLLIETATLRADTLGTETKTPNPNQPAATATQTPSRTPTLTDTPTATFTPTETPSPTPLPALCPETVPGLAIPETLPEDNPTFEAALLDLLNRGGLNEFRAKMNKYPDVNPVYTDLTQDSVAELLINTPASNGNIFVFGCRDKKFVTLLSVRPFHEYTPGILAVKDINKDGVKEIVLSGLTCFYCTGILVYGWRETHFEPLTRNHGDGEPTIAQLPGYTTASIKDVDNDGVDELLLKGGIPTDPNVTSGKRGPYREKTVVYHWDGSVYRYLSEESEPPIFRFEAVQDADSAFEQGNYDKAMSFYQRVLFDEDLASWNEDVWKQLIAEKGYPNVRQLPYDRPNYEQLAAYARYRILLLHLKRGQERDAEVVYETILQKYQPDTPGHPYAELAATLWAEYQQSNDLTLACQKAIAYTLAHPEIILPISTSYTQLNKPYSPETFCPVQ